MSINNGIEIDHGNVDMSAAVHNGKLTIGIVEDFSGRRRPDKPQGYGQYCEIQLTYEEASALSDWLTKTLADGKVS
jgi:hypothetical protein